MNLLSVAVFLLIWSTEARPPRNVPAAAAKPETDEQPTAMEDLNVEYNRYLQEVVNALESDPAFRKKLEEAKPEEIRDGTIAKDLDLVNHQVRTKLDEIKAKEMDRLIQLHRKKMERASGTDRDHIKIPQHLELGESNFGESDLRKLILSTTNDLEKADKDRREEFKKYEMEKRFEEEERLRHIQNEADRKAEEQRLKDLKDRHKKHENVHHPLTEDQLEEVWEKQDHMERNEFDPKTFFEMHDLDGNGYLDEMEIKSILNRELDKVYDKDRAEDDMKEKDEELERMREHVFKETDKDKDRMISFDEFMDQTRTDDFKKDEGWDTLDMQDGDYSEDEFREFEEHRQKEIKDMLDRGITPEGYPYFGAVPPGAQPVLHPVQGVPGSIPGQPAYVAPHALPGQPVYQQANQIPQQPAGGLGQPVVQHHVPVPQQQAGQPVVGQPVAGQHPVGGQPPVGQPVAGQLPVGGQPPFGQPVAGQHPVGGQPPVGQPVASANNVPNPPQAQGQP